MLCAWLYAHLTPYCPYYGSTAPQSASPFLKAEPSSRIRETHALLGSLSPHSAWARRISGSNSGALPGRDEGKPQINREYMCIYIYIYIHLYSIYNILYMRYLPGWLLLENALDSIAVTTSETCVPRLNARRSMTCLPLSGFPPSALQGSRPTFTQQRLKDHLQALAHHEAAPGSKH